jgi:hypothetical protein
MTFAVDIEVDSMWQWMISAMNNTHYPSPTEASPTEPNYFIYLQPSWFGSHIWTQAFRNEISDTQEVLVVWSPKSFVK